MNIPGFTAEASLYRTNKHFDSAAPSPGLATRETIVAQKKIVLEGFCFRNLSYCCFKNPDGTWTCARTIAT